MQKGVDKNFTQLRINLRKNINEISEDVFFRFHPSTLCRKAEICVFCQSTKNLTREHAIPKWVFQSDANLPFEIATNKQVQTYNKCVIPACQNCNNAILGFIEKHIIKTFNELQNSKIHSIEDLENIIRWLEIISYKLQVYTCRIKYLKYGNNKYDENWGIFQVALMQNFGPNPFKVLSHLRFSQRSICQRSKRKRLNSLVIFNTKKPHFNFFYLPTEYIFISFPMYNKAVFYFFRRNFKTRKDAENETIKIINKII